MKEQKTIFNFFEEKFDFKFKTLNFRFPVETLDTLLRRFYKYHDQSAFLVQAGKNVPSLALKKISRSYLLQVPTHEVKNERLYIGLSDFLCFLILFDEPEAEAQNINAQGSRFFITFDSILINAAFDYFYNNFCNLLSLKEKKLLIKLKNVRPNELSPYYVSKFQEALLTSALSDNNKAKQAKIVEALSFTEESIVITDLAGNIKEANKNFEKHFGKKEDKSTIKDILPFEIVEAAIKETNKKQKWQSEIELSSLQKKSELLLVNCYLFKDEINRPSGYVFAFKDITDLKKLDHLNKQLISKLRERNLQLSEVNKRLIEADRIKSDLLSVVSHELKTPVSTIIGFGELIANREYDEGTIKNFAEQITDSGKRLDRLITDYLDVASNQFGVSDDKLYTMPVNLLELIRNCYQEQKSKFKNIEFNFEVNCLGYEPIIITEKQNMQKLFGNLIDNSFKYSPSGGKVSVKVLNDGQNVTVSIADEGIGLTLDQARQVFDPFYRADNSVVREFPGIGLGLAVCKKIVEIYKGSIWCEPGVDLGTVFYVTLPVNPHVQGQVQEQKLQEAKTKSHAEMQNH